GDPVDARRGPGLGLASSTGRENRAPPPGGARRGAGRGPGRSAHRAWRGGVAPVWAKCEFTGGFAVPSYMAFEEKLAGFDLKFVAPKNAFVTPEPMAILARARNPHAAIRVI